MRLKNHGLPNLVSIMCTKTSTCHNSISILARMIAEAYIEELDQKRFAEMGIKRLYIEKIKITLDCVDLNNSKARQRLHALIDKAIETAEYDGLTKNSAPLVLKKDGLSIWLKV